MKVLQIFAAALLTALLVFTSSTMAQASSTDVKCVQQGLLDAGFDPNGVDGALGPGSRSAAAEFQQTVAGAALPDLTNDTAGSWCKAFQSAQIFVEMAEICANNNIDVSSRTATFVGQWYEHRNSTKEIFPYGIFVKAVDGTKVTGYYASSNYGDWFQRESCTLFVGHVTDEGNMSFSTSNNGLIERVVYEISDMLQEMTSSYQGKIDWNSQYGNTVGWAMGVVPTAE